MLSLSALVCAALLQPVAGAPSAPPVDSELPVRSERTPAAAAQREEAWSTERRRLQLHTGLSGAFAGVMLLTGTLLLVAPDGCGGQDCAYNLARAVAGIAMFPLATIPIGTGIYWGVRLGRHNRTQPTAVLRPRIGGVVLQF